MSLYLGGILIITQIVYFTMDKINELPKLIAMRDDAIPRQSMHKVPPRKKHKQRAKDQAKSSRRPPQMRDRAGCSGRPIEVKDTTEDIENLQRAMKINLEALQRGQGDQQELQDLAWAIQESMQQQEIICQALSQATTQPTPQVYPPMLAQMQLVKNLLNLLN